MFNSETERCSYPNCDESVIRDLAFIVKLESYLPEYTTTLYFCDKHKTPIKNQLESDMTKGIEYEIKDFSEDR